LLPLPAVSQSYPAQQVAYENLWADPPAAPAPVQAETLPSPSDQSVISGDYQAAMSGWSGSSCPGGVCGQPGCCQSNWFAYGGALLMARSGANKFNVSFDTGGPNTVLCSCYTDQRLSGGFEVTGGRMFNCGCNALAVTYWGLYPSDQTAQVYGSDMVGNLNSNFDFSGLNYNDGNGDASANTFFDDAQIHSIRSTYTIQNVEVNLLGGCCGVTPWSCGYGNGCGPRLSCNWLAGVRYFQFNESFSLGADNADTTLDGDLNEIYYDVRARNSLVGFQIGGGVNYIVNSRLSLYGTGKAGIYGNDMQVTHSVYGPNGSATFTNGDNCDTTGSRTGLAMIGQADLGIKWQISCRWSAQFGYRVLGAAGVATIADQMPPDFSNAGALQQINNGSLLLHGGYAGVQFCF
jgi:hypothetical protein